MTRGDPRTAGIHIDVQCSVEPQGRGDVGSRNKQTINQQAYDLIATATPLISSTCVWFHCHIAAPVQPVSGNLVYSFAIGQFIRPHIYSGEELPLFGESLLSREGYNCCKAVTALQHKPVHGIPVAGTAVTGFVMKDNEDDMASSMFPKGVEAGNAATIAIRTIRKVAGQTNMPPRYSKEFIATSSMTEQWIRRGLYPYVARSMETMASGLDDADGRVMKFLDSIQSNLSEDELQMEMGTFTSTGKRWIARFTAKLSQDSKNFYHSELG